MGGDEEGALGIVSAGEAYYGFCREEGFKSCLGIVEFVILGAIMESVLLFGGT